MVLINIKEDKNIQDVINSNVLTVLHFYADWAEQCGYMNQVLEELSNQKDLTEVQFAKCLAEDFPKFSLSYNISAVPTILLLKNGKLIDRINGSNAADLSKKIGIHLNKQLQIPEKSQNSEKEDINSHLKKLVNSSPVMLFMKGNKLEPKCGFSKSILSILNSKNIHFKTFDILEDEEVRQALKTYSNWPTYPQLYINGELIGGLDIIKEMAENGELEAVLPKQLNIEERLKSLINKGHCMVFMKGNRETPRCGFSRQLMEILIETGENFETFDILTDEDVRQGLKTYSNWPTYPQVYVKGELIGGLDIIKELKSSGELLNALKGES